MSVHAMLNTTATISSKGTTQSTTTGGMKPSWVDQSAVVPCCIQPAGSRESQQGDRETGICDYIGYFLPGSAPAHQDHIKNPGTLGTLRLEVVGEPEILTQGTIDFVRVRLRRVKGGPLL